MVILRLALAAAAAGALARLVRRRRQAPEPLAAQDVEVAPTDPVTEVVEQEWSCECGQAYRVSGEGRHRVHWPADAAAKDPVLDGVCVDCGRDLPRD